MADLLPLKDYFGKYYPELKDSCSQEKYAGTGLASLFEHRYRVPNKEMQLHIDPSLPGLQLVISEGEVKISAGILNHPHISVFNDLALDQAAKDGYNPDILPTMGYLSCWNRIKISFDSYIDTTVYIRYQSSAEIFFSSIVSIHVAPTAQVDIVEEFDGPGAVNVAANYEIESTAKLHLYTFYKPSAAGIILSLRNATIKERAYFKNVVLGKGSACVLDETKLYPLFRANVDILGIVDSPSRNFHNVLTVHPVVQEYRVAVEYKNIVGNTGVVSYYAGVVGNSISRRSSINVTDLNIDEISDSDINTEIEKFTENVLEHVKVTDKKDSERFYGNRDEFVYFNK